jgi:hypothetical protein
LLRKITNSLNSDDKFHTCILGFLNFYFIMFEFWILQKFQVVVSNGTKWFIFFLMQIWFFLKCLNNNSTECKFIWVIGQNTRIEKFVNFDLSSGWGWLLRLIFFKLTYTSCNNNSWYSTKKGWKRLWAPFEQRNEELSVNVFY